MIRDTQRLPAYGEVLRFGWIVDLKTHKSL